MESASLTGKLTKRGSFMGLLGSITIAVFGRGSTSIMYLLATAAGFIMMVKCIKGIIRTMNATATEN